MSLLGSRAVFTPTLLACYAITAAVHVASIVLNTLLPLHVADLGGTKTQVGLLFSVMTVVSMFLRPTVGGWVDRFGARPVIAPGIAAKRSGPITWRAHSASPSVRRWPLVCAPSAACGWRSRWSP